jgi:predicted Zn-dependent protease
MFEKRKLKKEIKRCRATIEEIERKRSRSQSALVQAVLLQEEPNEADSEWFNKYTGEITACRNHMIETQKRLDILMAQKAEKKNKK